MISENEPTEMIGEDPEDNESVSSIFSYEEENEPKLEVPQKQQQDVYRIWATVEKLRKFSENRTERKIESALNAPKFKTSHLEYLLDKYFEVSGKTSRSKEKEYVFSNKYKVPDPEKMEPPEFNIDLSEEDRPDPDPPVQPLLPGSMG